MELCSVLCGSLDGRGFWQRMDTCLCTTESLHCLSETVTTLLIGCTPIQNVFGVKKKNEIPESALSDPQLVVRVKACGRGTGAFPWVVGTLAKTEG